MKKLFIIALGVALLVLPMAINAAVDGGDHDMVDGTGAPVAAGLAALPNVDLCTSCHLPHNAVGAVGASGRLWAQAIGGAGGVAGLCQSCHDGTVAAEQLTTGSLPFTNTLHPHTDEVAGCSGVTASCHDVHTQNANGTGMFLATTAVSTGLCLDCHDGTFTGGGTYTLADQFDQTTNHPMGASLDCGDCHAIAAVHGDGTVVTQSGGVEATAGAWMLPFDNNTAGAWGGVCVACHEDQTAPYTAVLTTNGYPDGTFENSAPATMTGRHVTDGSGPNHTELMGGCDDCHFVHTTGFNAAADPSITMLQVDDNTDSDACAACHATASAPAYGTNSHPVDFEPGSGAPYLTALAAGYPASNVIDDASYGDANDYGSAVTHMVCETCHSVHRLGVATTPFLRGNNDNDGVCSACHVSN